MNDVTFSVHTYPAPADVQQELIGLWRSEWSRTDYDWLEALNGDYAESLAMISVIARVDGRAAATATVSYSRHAPETCLVGNVVTLAEHRGRGLAQAVTERALAEAAAAGCDTAYLGSSRREGNVYERCGFVRLRGAIMRWPAPGGLDTTFAPAQAAEVRAAHWGDMPGFVGLVAQPLATLVLDAPRGLMSMRHTEPVRCVSAFAAVHDEAVRSGGAMLVLGGTRSSRIFGFGTLTAGPRLAGSHRGVIDAVVHDAYGRHLPALVAHLLDSARARRVSELTARVAVADADKRAVLQAAGFTQRTTLTGHFRLGAEAMDAVELELVY